MIAHRHKRRGVWHETSRDEQAEAVRRAAGGLAALGVGEGTRVAIVGHNRPEWAVADLAVQSLGAVAVGLDATADSVSAEDAALVVAEDEEQLDKLAGFGGTLVVIDARGVRDEAVERWDELSAAEPAEPRGEGSAIVGGERYTHSRLRSEADALPVADGDEVLSYRPMHAAPERLLPLTAAVVNYGENVFEQDLREVQPTVLIGPSVLWERMHERVARRMQDASFLKRRCYGAALGKGAAGDVLALRALREKIGLRRARTLVCEGEVAPETREWFAAIGRPLT